jgi:hypothetical protein
MSHTPADSAIRLNPEQEKKISTMNHEELKSYLANLSVEQRLTTRDIFSPDVLIPTALADAAPKAFAQRVTVDGKAVFIQGESPEDLEQKVADFVRSQTQPAATETRVEQPRNERGQFTAAEISTLDAAKKAELLLQFQLGQIDAATYLEQSGEVADYLAKQGVPLEEVKQIVAEREGARFEQSWSDAVSEFLQSPAGRDWPGGQENLKTISEILKANNLEDAEDKVGAIAAAYEFIKKNELLAENPETTAHQRIASASSFEAVVEAARRSVGR